MRIKGLEEYGITVDELRKLGNRMITVHVAFKPQCYDSRLSKLPREERIALFKKLKRKSIDRCLQPWPNKNIKMRGDKEYPTSFDSIIEANKLVKYAKRDIYDSIEIVRIPGLKKYRKKKQKEFSWYAVRARVAWQIEGQKKGYQTVEDRILLLKAYSEDDAVRRLSREWKNYENPTMVFDGYLMRLHMEEVTDVYKIIDSELDSKGTEVFSSLHERRMKPEYEWHPFSD